MELKVISRIPESNLVPGEDIVAVVWIEGMLLAAMNTKENNGYVKVFSPDLHLLQDLWAHECAIYHMTSGQGSQFYTSASDSTIRQWGLGDDGQFSLQDILRGHHEPPWKLRFDLQAKRLYSGDSTGQVRMWEDGEEVGCLGTVEEIWDMLINDGILFTTRHLDVYLICFKTRENDDKMTWSIKNTIPGRGPLLVCDGKLCLITRATYEIAIHDLVKSGNPLIAMLKGHDASVSALVTDTGCTILYSGGYDGKVIAWDFKTFERLAEIKLEGYITDMTFDHKSGVLYAGGENRFICALKLESSS